MADLLSRTDEHVASVQESPSPARRKRRVASLDIVRGFSVALMVFVDEVGHVAVPLPRRDARARRRGALSR